MDKPLRVGTSSSRYRAAVIEPLTGREVVRPLHLGQLQFTPALGARPNGRLVAASVN